METVHIKTDVISIRAYQTGKCYKNKDAYIGIVTGYVLSDTRIHLTAGHGDFSLDTIREIRSKLKLRGFKKITFERHKKFTTKHI